MKSCCHFKSPFSPGFLLQAGILLLLSKEELHGYEIMSRLSELFPEFFCFNELSRMGEGYRFLRSLEFHGYINSRWEVDERGGPAKRIYSITESGKKLLEGMTNNIEKNLEFLKKFLEYARQKEVE